ncbi:MAG: hypothetical protein O2955_10895 [Planctomycetota bacterium]|nr:hypothetical protein [Planctomycetota bacterium]MDA1213019.1 hypothetical protein [Planctomycetota bacterium]
MMTIHRLIICLICAACFGGCGKSPEEIVRDRFRDFLLDPIPESVTELRFVNRDDERPGVGLMLRFKIHPDDFEKIAVAKNLHRRQPGEFLRDDDPFNDPDFFKIGDNDELYESFRTESGSYSLRVNAEHTEVVFQSDNRREDYSQPPDFSDRKYESIDHFFDTFKPKTWELVNSVDSVPVGQRKAVNALIDACVALYRDVNLPDQPIVYAEAGWNPLSYDYLDYESSRPDVGDDTVRHLAVFSQLRRIDLINSQITDGGLLHLKGLKHLESLNLEGTQFGDEGLRHVAAMTQLKVLKLQRTKITDAGLKSLESLRHLEILDLDATSVTSNEIRSLASLKKLRGLDLSFTHVSDDGLVHLRNLTNLEYLNIGPGGQIRLHIGDSAVTNLANLTKMRWLSLRGSKISNDGLKALRKMKHLEYLDVSSTAISDEGLKHLSGLTELRVLSLDNCENITGTGFVHFQGLSQLLELDASSTAVTENSLEHLCALTSLKILNVCSTQLGDGAVQHLAKLPSLETLWICYAPFSETGFYELRERRPKMMIMHYD